MNLGWGSGKNKPVGSHCGQRLSHTCNSPLAPVDMGHMGDVSDSSNFLSPTFKSDMGDGCDCLSHLEEGCE